MANQDDQSPWRVPRLRTSPDEQGAKASPDVPPPIPRRRLQTPQHGEETLERESTSELVLDALRDDQSDAMSGNEDPPATSALLAAARCDAHGEIERSRGKVDLRLPAATAVLSADTISRAGSSVALGELESFAVCGDKQVLFCRVSRRGFFVGVSEGAENPEVTFDALLRETEIR